MMAVQYLHMLSPMLPALSYGFLALGLCTLLHLLALKLFPRFGLLDRPEKYHLARVQRLPHPTGILSVLTFLILLTTTRETFTLQSIGLIVCLLLLATTTFVDDLRTLPPALRLCIQIFIGFLLFATGTRIYTITNPLETLGIGGSLIKLDTIDIGPQFLILNSQFSIPFGPLPLWSGVFTILWIVLTTNAFNWFDGIPGQVSILSAIGALTIGLLSLTPRVNQPEIAVIAFMLGGTALASAAFDVPPQRVVMGDTGAMFFGLMLGTLSIYAGGKVATAFLVLGVPLLDAVFVLTRRILRRESPFKGNLDHLHHRLRAKGWTERHVIALTVVLGSTFGVTALFLNTFQKFLAIILLLLLHALLTFHSRSEMPTRAGPVSSWSGDPDED